MTGGSKGLGAVICRKFAAEGCNVAINFNSDADAAEALAQDLRASSGTKAITVKAVRSQKPLLTRAKTTTIRKC